MATGQQTGKTAKHDRMSAVDIDEAASGFQDVAQRGGRAVTVEQARRLARFAELLLVWNARINLVGFDTFEALVEDHFPDALAAAAFVRSGSAVIDVGSGGGLPALPLALLEPEAKYLLVEPVAKKAAFLRTAVRELGLRGTVTVRHDRVTQPVSAAMRAQFDVALARAVFSPADWLALGLELVRPAGRVLVFATPDGARHLRPRVPRLLAEVEYKAGRTLVVAGP